MVSALRLTRQLADESPYIMALPEMTDQPVRDPSAWQASCLLIRDSWILQAKAAGKSSVGG